MLHLDIGPQYSSAVFTEFDKQYDLTHTTRNAQYPQANGAAEHAVHAQ